MSITVWVKGSSATLEQFLAENEELLKSIELGLIEKDFNTSCRVLQ